MVWTQCYKTFYGRNLRIFVISLSVSPLQAFPAYSHKRSSLVRKLKNTDVKCFITLAPGPNVIKLLRP